MHLEPRQTPASRLMAQTYDAVPDWVASVSAVSSDARDDVGVTAPPMHTADKRAAALLTTVFLRGCASAAFPAVSAGAHMSSDNLAEETLQCPTRNGPAGLKEYTDCITAYVCVCARARVRVRVRVSRVWQIPMDQIREIRPTCWHYQTSSRGQTTHARTMGFT